MKTGTKDNQYIDDNQYDVKLWQCHIGRHYCDNQYHENQYWDNQYIGSQYKTSNCGNETSGEI